MKMNILKVTSLAFIGSIFIPNKVIFAVCISLWLIAVVINAASVFDNDIMLQVDEVTWKKALKCKSEKKYIKALAYHITVPMMGIGLLVVILDLAYVWYLAFAK